MNVLDLITRHEGSEASPYLDSLGISTVGVGHNLVAHPLPGQTYPMTDDQIQALLASDLQQVVIGLNQALPWLGKLDEVRQAVLYDMAFNMGVSGLLQFRNTLALVEAGSYEMAGQNMLLSKWAQQVGIRATEDSEIMTTGQWPTQEAA